MLAHAGTPDEAVSAVLLGGSFWLGYVARQRGRERPSRRVPRWRLPVMWASAGVLAVAGLTAVAWVRPLIGPSAVRPTSAATIAFEEPTQGEVVSGNVLQVRLHLVGGRIVPSATTTLTSDTGHVHLSLDGSLVSMTYGLQQTISLIGQEPGNHVLQAEFVAADHAPFSPRVLASVAFTLERGSG
ncbi:MAG TPA: hypothetical protein VH989_08175 [Actinomycetota bacterium]